MRLNALGTHILVDMKDCNRRLLDDLPFIQEALLTAAREAGATIVGQTFHKFSPHGVTGVVAIAESHLCIHTWPEYGYAAVDIFTCGDSFQPEKAADYLAEALECQNPCPVVIKRGILAGDRGAGVSAEAAKKSDDRKARQRTIASV